LWPNIAQQVGLDYLWGALVGSIFMFFIATEAVRYTLATGETIITGFARLWRGWTIGFIEWAFVNAIWSVPVQNGQAQTAACRELRGVGACWAVITEKHRFILFGTYPYEEHWRPARLIGLLVVVAALAVGDRPRLRAHSSSPGSRSSSAERMFKKR
jgi:hypothetical protein